MKSKNKAPQEVNLLKDESFSYSNRFNQNLHLKNNSEVISINTVTLNDLARIIIFKYGSIKKFSNKMGWTKSRGYQILKGYNPPKNIETLKKMASLLDIDSVVLAEVLFREQQKNEEVVSNA